MYLVMFFPIKWISNVIYIPRQRLYPVIIMMCVVGAYSTMNGRMFDVWCLILFGAVGYLFKKVKFPSTCFLIGFILGRDLENYFIQAISSRNGSLSVFFTRPIGLVIWLLIAISIGYAIYDNRKDAKR